MRHRYANNRDKRFRKHIFKTSVTFVSRKIAKVRQICQSAAPTPTMQRILLPLELSTRYVFFVLLRHIGAVIIHNNRLSAAYTPLWHLRQRRTPKHRFWRHDLFFLFYARVTSRLLHTNHSVIFTENDLARRDQLPWSKYHTTSLRELSFLVPALKARYTLFFFSQ